MATRQQEPLTEDAIKEYHLQLKERETELEKRIKGFETYKHRVEFEASEKLKELNAQIEKNQSQNTIGPVDPINFAEISRQLQDMTSIYPSILQQIHDINDRIKNFPVIDQKPHPTHSPTPIPVRTNPDPPVSPHSNASQGLNIRDALDSVEKFDGGNMSVLSFVRNCRRASKVIPTHLEPSFAKLLRTRLFGRALLAFDDESHFDSVAEFTDRVREIFGENHSVNYYRGELANSVKTKKEHIVDYISRIKDLRTAILEGEIKKRVNMDECCVRELDDDVMEAFLAGLHPTFRTQLRQETFFSLSEAFNKAIQVDKQNERDKLRFNPLPAKPPPNIQNPPRNSPSPPTQNSNAQNPNQNNRGYSNFNGNQNFQNRANNNYPQNQFNRNNGNFSGGQPRPNAQNSQNYNNNNFNRNQNPSGQQNPNEKFCRYCKKPGHVIETCRTRENNNMRANENNTTQSGNEPTPSTSRAGVEGQR